MTRFIIEKDGVKMAARDNNQLAAFLNNGWTLATTETPKVEAKAEKEVAGTIPEELTAEAVQAMPYFSLKSEAKKRGIEAEGKKADTLREELIAAL